MIPYIIKTILCSASLFVIYYLLLEREKMYRFNRFYLFSELYFIFNKPQSLKTQKDQDPKSLSGQKAKLEKEIK